MVFCLRQKGHIISDKVMSDFNNQLATIAIEVHGVLNRYIAVHNHLFKPSLRRVIALPLIFKPIDFKQLHSQSSEFIRELEEHSNHLKELKPQAAQSEFANTLSEFCSALIETISLLKEITYQLDQRSGGMGDYSLSRHNELVDLYYESVKRYSSIGFKLNKYIIQV